MIPSDERSMALTLQTRNQYIRSIRQEVGWVYSQLKWLREEEAIRAREDRDKLLRALSGKVNESCLQSKLHQGALSRGCVICGDGTWSCLFINGLCTTNCFFCPQDRGLKEERPPTENGIVFHNPKDYADFVQKVGYKGVGFSGGETLLVYDLLLSFIEKLREKNGDDTYLWLYTNGDLIDREKLEGLKQAGLNEIRFNIYPRKYDLDPVKLALDFIDTVTVEIPAIPEDLEVVKGAISIMENMGVHHLNLHQLLTTEYNYANIVKRGYSFLHHPHVPVFETEMTALKLLIFVLEKGISLPINYCSSAYKSRFQARGNRIRPAFLARQDFEDITGSGYIRKVAIQGTSERVENLVKNLEASVSSNNRWSLNKDRTTLAVHPSLLEHVQDDNCKFTLSYFEAGLTDPVNLLSLKSANTDESYAAAELSEMNLGGISGSKKSVQKLILNTDRTVFTFRQLAAEYKDLSLMAIRGFQKLFMEKMNEKDVFRWFSENYDIATKEKIQAMGKEKTILAGLKTWEQIPEGFPEIY